MCSGRMGERWSRSRSYSRTCVKQEPPSQPNKCPHYDREYLWNDSGSRNDIQTEHSPADQKCENACGPISSSTECFHVHGSRIEKNWSFMTRLRAPSVIAREVRARRWHAAATNPPRFAQWRKAKSRAFIFLLRTKCGGGGPRSGEGDNPRRSMRNTYRSVILVSYAPSCTSFVDNLPSAASWRQLRSD